MSTAVNLVPENEDEPMAVEIIEEAIVKIATAMERINSTRLTRKALVVLIANQSKLPQKTINIVLNNLEDLERDWLKPKRKLGVNR